ncbi:MAG: VCBS repeat-containing protein, partial [Flavobacteriales bacterium]|nr:VCBS repeat-containing protein [Flavobacteriales bacterium]
MKNSLTILIIILLSMSTQAQSFFRNDSIIVLKSNNDTLKNPWAGGFNSVQFSEIDLNLDGIMDIISFDRSGNKLNTFINSGQSNTISYTHAPQYIQNFPKMISWVLLRDYNCDGKMDIFTYFNAGIRVYRNTSSATTLSFTLENNLIESDYQPDSASNFTTIYVSNSDIPAIDDIDGDGDLDVLTFSILGERVEYHKNLSIETYGTCDSLSFQLANRCWGFFKESSSSGGIILYDTCNTNIINPEKENKHGGSTLLTLDVDANNSKDLVLGDVSFNNLTLLSNGDASLDLTASSMFAKDTAFPANNLSTIAASLPVFPAAYYLDVDNDNIKDLIVSTNCSSSCKSNDNVWLYKNNNADNNPDFSFASNSFLQGGMIEVGEGAHPTFFDYNADGLMDLVIGNYRFFDTNSSSNFKSSLWLYKNIGTLTTPAFQLIDSDYVNISTINLNVSANSPETRLTPTFGDLDGDGDMDMLVGDFSGRLHFFENTAGAGNTTIFVLNQVQYQNIYINLFAAPQLVDLNRDGLLDLVVGDRSGYLNYYENTGTITTPIFSFITSTLGNVKTRRSNEFNGNSMPFVYEHGGVYKILAGATNGYIYQFTNIDGNLNGTFSIDSTFQNIWEGTASSVAMADLNNDGNLDLITGNSSGGISYYQADFITNAYEINSPNPNKMNIYPNPTHNKININLDV